MNLKYAIIIFTSLFTNAIDVETMIQNASDNVENVIINPITGKEYNIYTTYDLAQDLIKLNSVGKLNIPLKDALETIKNANPNHSKKFTSDEFIKSLTYNAMKSDYNTRLEIIDYANNYVDHSQPNYHLKHLKIGSDTSQLQTSSIEDLKNHITSFGNYIDMEEALLILESRSSELSAESASELISHFLYTYLNSNTDLSSLKSLIENSGFDISNLACEKVRQDTQWLTNDDEYTGTLEMVNWAKKESPEEVEFYKENYQRNLEDAANTINRLEFLGVSKGTKCSETETLFDILANDDFFNIDDLNKELKKLTPTQQQNSFIQPCVATSTIELFKSCDFAKILWHLEKIERQKIKNNLIIVTGDNIGNCEAYFESKIRGKQKITLLKVIRNDGVQAEIESSPTNLINYISK